MNPSFTQTGTSSRFRHPQPPGPRAIPSKYLWNFTPPPPRPPTPALANGGGRKRSVDDNASYDLKRPRLASPGPGHAPFVGRTPPSVSWAAQDGSAHTPQPHPQSPPSLWGGGPVSSSQLQPYTKDKLSGQIVDLYDACQQKSSDLERKELCRTQLQKEIQKLFPASRIYLAGSSLNGFGSSSSDADLCLVLPSSSVPVLWTDPILVLTEIYQRFRQLGYLRNVQLIRAKVPILKARDSVSAVEFDLNVNNTVGIRNTFLLRSYAYLEPRVRPLVLVVKKWAQHYDINDASKGTLSSYTLVLMVLHYLQTLQNPVVPSLQKQYPECFNVSMDIHMVPEGPRHIPPYSSSNRASLGDLLLGFLKYYGCSYRWDQSIVSVRDGKTLPKNSSYEWKNKFICVEEPFEKKNTARAVHEKAKFDTIRTRFTESWRALQQSQDLNSILPVRLITSQGR